MLQIKFLLTEVQPKQYVLGQGPATYGPRAGSGPPGHFTRPVTIYCHSARDFFSFLIIVMQQ